MARPLCPRKRQAIIDSACKLFATESLDVTTNKIAKEAGVSEGTIFTYFKNKDDLFNHIYIAIRNEVDNLFRNNIKQNNSQFDSVMEFIDYAQANWIDFINWSVNNPYYHITMQKFKRSNKVDPEIIDNTPENFRQLESFILYIAKFGPYKEAPPTLVADIPLANACTIVDYVWTNQIKDKKLIVKFAKMAFESTLIALSSMKLADLIVILEQEAVTLECKEYYAALEKQARAYEASVATPAALEMKKARKEAYHREKARLNKVTAKRGRKPKVKVEETTTA